MRGSWFNRLSTVIIRFSARTAFSTSREGAYSRQGTYFFFQKQPPECSKQNLKIYLKGTIAETATVTNIW